MQPVFQLVDVDEEHGDEQPGVVLLWMVLQWLSAGTS